MEHANADNRMQPEAPLIYRTKLPVRIWHWINAFSIFVMLMSGMSIFNAHPASTGASTGELRPAVAGDRQPRRPRLRQPARPGTAGRPAGRLVRRRAGISAAADHPSHYDLAGGREWHFFFAWVLAISATLFLLYAAFAALARSCA
jgi:thiosulfate reductase cytochrome b subunit